LPFFGWVDAGESFGQQSAEYYAQVFTDPNASILTKFGAFVGGSLASLWTRCTSDTTFGVLSTAWGVGKWVNRPFWQYYPAGDGTYASNWYTRGLGWNQPFALGSEASEALNLPVYNPATAVRTYVPPWWQPMVGPGRLGGSGWEYYRGFFWPH
jgi:hypothetical protein